MTCKFASGEYGVVDFHAAPLKVFVCTYVRVRRMCIVLACVLLCMRLCRA